MKWQANKIDIFSFCATAAAKEPASIAEKTPLSQFKRFLEGLPPQLSDVQVDWAVVPKIGKQQVSLVHVSVSVNVLLQCQRCGQPLEFAVRSQQEIEVVEDWDASKEEQFDVDALLEEYEQVPGSTTFDLYGLVEDELILSIPYIPVHEECPRVPLLEDVEVSAIQTVETKRPSPFAVLEALKKT